MLEILPLLIVVSIFVEGFIEYFVSNPDMPQPWLKYVSAVISVLLSIAFGLDLFKELGLMTSVPLVGSVMTGVIVSRGSNYINDFISKVRRPNIIETIEVTPDENLQA